MMTIVAAHQEGLHPVIVLFIAMKVDLGRGVAQREGEPREITAIELRTMQGAFIEEHELPRTQHHVDSTAFVDCGRISTHVEPAGGVIDRHLPDLGMVGAGDQPQTAIIRSAVVECHPGGDILLGLDRPIAGVLMPGYALTDGGFLIPRHPGPQDQVGAEDVRDPIEDGGRGRQGIHPRQTMVLGGQDAGGGSRSERIDLGYGTVL